MTKKWKWIMAGLLAALLAAAGFAPADDAITVPDGAGIGDLTALEPCDYERAKTTYQAECGTLTVPENWEDPDSRLIALPVIRIPATGPDPAEPVFYLAGGPGGPNLSMAPPAWLLETHDVVMVGYRGVEGASVLDCPDLNQTLKSYLGNGIFSDAARADFEAGSVACAQALQASGVDLAGYTVTGTIRDLEAARTALGYDRINLFSESYGTRVAQIYAYLYPGSLHRVVMIGLNTPGHFIYDRDALDDMVRHMAALCAEDSECSGRTDDLAATIYEVNRNMPDRWLFLPVDPGSVRLATHMMIFSQNTMPMAIRMYLDAGEGDYAALAMMTLMGRFVFPPFVWGDLLSKGGSLDLPYYEGPESIELGDSILGSPLSELIWALAAHWPVALEDDSVRTLQETDVDMLVVNGTVDFSTPPTAIEEARPYWHNMQAVLLPEFSHVGDVETLQPEAFERLITSYYHTGTADAAGFEYQPIPFTEGGMDVGLMAKLMVGLLLVLPPLLIAGVVLGVRRIRRRRLH